MCYDAQYLIKKQLQQAERLGASNREIEYLQMDLWRLTKSKSEKTFEEFVNDLPQYYHVSGFSHPPIVMLRDFEKGEHVVGIWGLIPFWVKSKREAYDFKKPYNSNLNAQSETVFEKKAFKNPARYRRCVMSLEAYYESHHQNNKTYPFRIFRADGKSLWVAGIYEQNEIVDDNTGELIEFNSMAILTCEANAILSRIHNNPKMVKRTGHRMLVLLEENQLTQFLQPFPESNDEQELRLFEKSIMNLCQPYDESLLAYEPVRNLKERKEMPYIGNVPGITERFDWSELDMNAIFH